MGKDLKGKELGKGLTQEKNGYYVARFVDRFGKRQSKRFKKISEARQWLADSMFLDEHSSLDADMLVDEFVDMWLNTNHKMSKIGTVEAYRVRYDKSIKPFIGHMKISEVKVNNCQMIINDMIDKDYGNSTIKITYAVLRGIFDYAIECEIIFKNPCVIKVKGEVGKAKKKKEALTKEEHKKFLDIVKDYQYYDHFRFVLQTGLRVGELQALKWEDVDFENRLIHVSHSMHFSKESKTWTEGAPKSVAGRRKIPLTDEAIEILKSLKTKDSKPYDYIFVSSKGQIVETSTYDRCLRVVAKKMGIDSFSIHILRHTFATRCAQAGMNIKTLQSIMGHSSIDLTMSVYVSLEAEEMFKEMKMFSAMMQNMFDEN